MVCGKRSEKSREEGPVCFEEASRGLDLQVTPGSDDEPLRRLQHSAEEEAMEEGAFRRGHPTDSASESPHVRLPEDPPWK